MFHHPAVFMKPDIFFCFTRSNVTIIGLVGGFPSSTSGDFKGASHYTPENKLTKQQRAMPAVGGT